MHHLVKKVTYSPEDNRLRVYVVDSDERFDSDISRKLKELGFKWAPQQRFFGVAWNLAREDLCLELGDTIVADEFTVVERAEAKAERLEALADKRVSEFSGWKDTANRLLSASALGQPILVGHHSQRKAEKLVDKSDQSYEKAKGCAEAALYWSYRAQGVLRYANSKANRFTRLNRIEALLKELRDNQRALNHAFYAHDLWKSISELPDEKRTGVVEYYSGLRGKHGPISCIDSYGPLRNGTISHDEVIDKNLKGWMSSLSNSSRARTMTHILNRLNYEYAELGNTPRVTDKLTATLIKNFARKHGTDSPTCKKADDGDGWLLSSEAPLPVHIADGKELKLSEDGWRDLMQMLGYMPPAPKCAKPSLLNLNVAAVKTQRRDKVELLRVVSMTKEEYRKRIAEEKATRLATCGGFRVRICLDPKSTKAYYSRDWVAVYLSDSKEHKLPESESIVVTDVSEAEVA